MAANEESFQKIIDMLVELKDTSEIMMDLAYSSILYNSKELAQEVKMRQTLRIQKLPWTNQTGRCNRKNC
jgi:uncharacterized protein with PhoU and TrkA domain